MTIMCAAWNTAGAQDADDVLMTVGDMPVTVGEFRYIYEKNNGEEADYSEASVEEYLELYKKFKLKVAKAKDLKMDTIEVLRSELETYRKQLANSYLMDREVKEKLIKRAFDRRQEDVSVAHILIKKTRVNGKDPDEEAFKRAMKIKEEITEGTISWSEAVKKFSNDNASIPYDGSMGYMTAMLPAGFVELERAMYDAEVGEIVGPVKTKLGYHVVKVVDRRPARGSVDAAHVLVRKPKGGTMEEAKTKAMQAYSELKAGKPWGKVVTQYSDDMDSKRKDGSIGTVSIGQYAAAFEDAVFGLTADGAYSEPVKTKAGYHIILRKSKEDLGDYDKYRRQLDAKIERLPRYADAKEQLIDSIKRKYNYKVNEAAVKHFIVSLDDDFFTQNWSPKEVKEIEIFRFNEDQYMLEDFVDYLKKDPRSRRRYKRSKSANLAVRELLEKYSDEEAILYEETNLEASYPDFRNLMREYREGILLFEASKVNIWDKASADTVGLKRFFENNQARYSHPATAKTTTLVAKTTDRKLLKKIKKRWRKKGVESALKKFNKKDPAFLKVIEGEVAEGSKEAKALTWEVGAIGDPAVDTKASKTTITKVEEILPGRAKTLEEARGYVIADYQDHLERQWVNQLKQDYPIKVNKNVYKALIK